MNNKYNLNISLDEILPPYIRLFKRLRRVYDRSEIIRIRSLAPYYHRDYVLSYNVALRYEFVKTKTMSYIRVYLPHLINNQLCYFYFERQFDNTYSKCDVIDATFNILCANLSVCKRSYNLSNETYSLFAL